MRMTRSFALAGAVILGCWLMCPDARARSGTDSLLEEGTKLNAEGRYRAAIELLTPGSGDSVTGPVAFTLGTAYSALNDFKNARRFLQKAVDLLPERIGYRFQLARLLVQVSLAGEAADQYETILARDSSFLPAIYQLGLLMYERRDYGRAADYFRRIVRLNPADFISQYYLGACYATMERPDSARYVLSACVTLQPTYTPAVALLASLYFSKPDYRQALRLYSRAVQLRPDNADLLYREGLCHEKLSDYASAIRAYRTAIRNDTAHVHAWAHLGQALFQIGKYDSAIAAYEQAVRLEEDNPTILVNIALAWERKDSLERAAQSFERAVRACQPDQIARLYSQLAALRFNAKQFGKAKDAYRRALQVDPTFTSSRFFLAVAHDQLKEYALAREAYRSFLRQAGSDSTMADKARTARDRLEMLGRRR